LTNKNKKRKLSSSKRLLWDNRVHNLPL